MAYPADENINTLEKKKFLETSSNDIAVRTIVDDGAIISTLNSTTTPLGAGETFTGTWEDVSEYASVTVMMHSDQDSATLGGQIQFSSDGTNIDISNDGTYSASVDGHPVTFPPQAKYFRFVFTNGATPQTFLRIQSVFGKNARTNPFLMVSDSVPSNFHLPIQRNIVTAQKASGEYANVQATNGGNFKVSLEELESGVSVNSNSQLKTTSYDSSGNEVFTAFGKTTEHFNGNIALAGTPTTITPTSARNIQQFFIMCNSVNDPWNPNAITDALRFSLDAGTTWTTVLSGESQYVSGDFASFQVDTNVNGTNYQIIVWS